MSDMPAGKRFPAELRIAPLSDSPSTAARSSSGPPKIPGIQIIEPAKQATSRPFLAFIGLLLLTVGVALGTITHATWLSIVTLGQGIDAAAQPATDTWLAGRPWTTESAKWIASIVLGLLGLSCLRARALSAVVTAALFAVAAYTCDILIGGRLRDLAASVFGEASPRYVLPIVSAIFGYVVHAALTREGANFRGIIGLLIVAAAALGTINGWYDWTPLIKKLGPGAEGVLKDWGVESTWATVLILTALGVATSRTKPVFFLVALTLGCLAWYCVSSGMAELRTFPSLAKGDYIPSVEHVSYKNVEPWRWVVAAELGLLAIVLAHMSLGMGVLNVGFALFWMFGGLAVYNSVSNMSIARFISEGAVFGAQQQSSARPSTSADPLSGFGLPVAAPTVAGQPDQPALTSQDEALRQARVRAMQRMQRPVQVREVTPLVWMLATAILAGIFAVAGVAMMTSSQNLRLGTLAALWFACGVLCTTLCFLWPKDYTTFEGWLAAFRYSRYHTGVYWIAFLASAGLAGIWALRPTADTAAWVHASAAAILLGTCLSLGAAAILIGFGNFPKLPAWVYIAMTVGQSSLMWALLMRQSYRARRPALSP